MSKAPEFPATRIITLLEQNDASDPNSPSTPGQWTNNLEENTILREGDTISVRQSMIDTTNESEGLIEVEADETEITIQFGMYVQDSGVGTEDAGTQAETYLTHSEAAGNIPNGRNYVLQNQSKGLPFQEMWYTAGGSYAGSQAVNPGVAGDPPTGNDFSIKFIPKPAGDPGWWQFTIDAGAPAYAAPVGGPFPLPPTSAVTSPILLPENLQGLRAILYHDRNAAGEVVTHYRIYSDGWEPFAEPGPDQDDDHIAEIGAVFSTDKTITSPLGYTAKYNPLHPQSWSPTPNANNWVFRTAVIGTTDQSAQYFATVDPDSGKISETYAICEQFRMIVFNFEQDGTSPNATDAPYQQTFFYTDLSGKETSQSIYLSDWGNANEVVYGFKGAASPAAANGIFYRHEVTGDVYGLGDLDTTEGRASVGYTGPAYNGTIAWINFQQLQDSKNPSIRIFEPFVFDIHKGIRVLPNGSISGKGQEKRTKWGGKGFAFGIFNPRDASGNDIPLLSSKQFTTSSLPVPSADGVVLTPRIFTQKITIPQKKYTYDALAQELTDRFNAIPRQVPPLNNNPFGDAPPADNAVGFSGSRILTSTKELGMQQRNIPGGAITDFEPFFPSQYVWDATKTAMQPTWVSDDANSAVQYLENIVGAAPVWCGAESLSFIYDETSDTFQIAQAHSNMYSRLDGGIIARQFKVDTAAGVDTGYVTTDKAGGIFFTSMEPRSLFFDKMKLNAATLLTPIASNPGLRDLTLPGGAAFPQNANLGNSLCHTTNLLNGNNITGNFLGLGTKIDKRVRIVSTPPDPASDISGGFYQLINTGWALDVAVSTPITISGEELTDKEVTDPYYQIEINGLVRQDILGAETKNNLIQSIVGKYFTNGGYTSGNVEDGFRYTHVGEPISLRSMSVRILDSNGQLATGLGETSAVILEVDSDK